ncbi:hypothetical protein SDC9_51482 [bioreactor metagenome]|uniref:Uncharacterized protein n=1 Tax=bioreactor metagenome TaxID=1076179 RepID=A0A644WSI0_9ZZZZ
MKSFFRRDNFWLGIGISLVLPVLTYFLLQLISMIFATPNGEIFKKSTDQLLAVCSNLIPFRYYLVKLKADKTGKGIMLITFVMAIIYFYLNWSA